MPEFFDGPAEVPDPERFLPVVHQRARRRHLRNVVLSVCSVVLVLSAAGVGVAVAVTGGGGRSDNAKLSAPPTSHTSSPSVRPTSPAPGDLTVTAQLLQQVRDSYYAAYRADANAARDFGVRGATASDVTEPAVSHAGVVHARHAGQDVYWVVAAICFRQNLVGCQDAGSYQVFTGKGPGGEFQYLGFAPCRIPSSLASRWYPDRQYPMGASCPSPR